MSLITRVYVGQVSTCISFKALVLCVAVTACHGDTPNASSAVDTLAADPPTSAAVSARESETIRTADSADVFDPDGYYLFADTVSFGDWNLEHLQLTTVSYYYDGELHYDRPRVLEPTAVLALSRLRSTEVQELSCSDPVISREGLELLCPGTPVGTIAIRGRFLDTAGKFWNVLRYEEVPTVLAIAQVTTTDDGAALYDREHGLLYTSGH